MKIYIGRYTPRFVTTFLVWLLKKLMLTYKPGDINIYNALNNYKP